MFILVEAYSNRYFELGDNIPYQLVREQSKATTFNSRIDAQLAADVINATSSYNCIPLNAKVVKKKQEVHGNE